MEYLISVLYIIICIALFLATATFIVINVYYLYIHRKYSHIPCPKGARYYHGHVAILSGRLKEGAYLMDTFQSWADECGPVYVFWIYIRPVVVAAHPDVIKELGTIKHSKAYIEPFVRIWKRQRFVGNSLFTIQHHHEWKDRRKTYDPSFSRRYLDDLIPQFNKVIHKYLVEEIKRHVADGNTVVDMKNAFSKVTLEVISWVAFGMDFFEDEYVTKLCGSQDLLRLIDLASEGAILQMNNPVLPYIKPFGGYKYTNAAAKLREIGRYCILKRIESIKNGEQNHQDILTQIITLSQKQGDIKLEDLVDDFVTFYVGGQETTSNTLSFALISILQSPALLQRAIAEIDEVIGDSAVIEKKHLDGLEFIQAVIEETLRLHPTVAFFAKCSAYDITTSDFRIPKNAEVLCSSYILQRDPNNFENPLEFDPSRFEAGQKRPSPYIYCPFGIGHRSCIARTFAMMEAKIVVALLLKNFEMTLPEGYVFKKILFVTSKPAGGIPCTVTLRN